MTRCCPATVPFRPSCCRRVLSSSFQPCRTLFSKSCPLERCPAWLFANSATLKIASVFLCPGETPILPRSNPFRAPHPIVCKLPPLVRVAVASLVIAFSFLLPVLLVGCGMEAAPQPPSLQLPKPIADLSASRTGNQVQLEWNTPKENTDHLRLQGLVQTAHLPSATGNVSLRHHCDHFRRARQTGSVYGRAAIGADSGSAARHYVSHLWHQQTRQNRRSIKRRHRARRGSPARGAESLRASRRTRRRSPLAASSKPSCGNQHPDRPHFGRVASCH